jgi:hypothetical protein
MGMSKKTFGSFLIGLYAWVITISFGMVLLDIIYSRVVPAAAIALSEVSDFLLLIVFITFLSAITAIVFSWNATGARNLLIASQVVILFEFLIPALLSPFVQNMQGLTIGPWLRIIPSGASSILAFIGLQNYNKNLSENSRISLPR